MAQWYIMYNNQQVGPMDISQLRAYGLQPGTQVWTEGMPQWAPAYTIPELMVAINSWSQQSAPGSGMPPVGGPVNNTVPGGKDHVVAGILALVLGSLGIHYFYMGKVSGGLLCLGITLISAILCVLIIGFALLSVWSVILLVQVIMMLTMSQQQFEQKYLNSTSVMPVF